MSKIIIFGAGKIADTAYHYLKNDSPYEISGFTVDKNYIKSDKYHGLPLVPFENVEEYFSPIQYKMLVLIGYQNLNKIRAEKYFEAKNKGYKFISYINSHASIGIDTEIGDNCFICEFNSIQPGVKIGNNVVMWPNNIVSHHSIIKDHNWITAGVTISGSTTIESYCFIGVNTAIGHNIKIGSETLIGASSTITKNVDPKSVFITENTPKYKFDSTTFLRFTNLFE